MSANAASQTRSAAECGERRESERHAAGRGDHLPALREAEVDRAGVAEHRRRAGEDADPVATEPETDGAGTKPFATSSSATESPSDRP